MMWMNDRKWGEGRERERERESNETCVFSSFVLPWCVAESVIDVKVTVSGSVAELFVVIIVRGAVFALSTLRIDFSSSFLFFISLSFSSSFCLFFLVIAFVVVIFSLFLLFFSHVFSCFNCFVLFTLEQSFESSIIALLLFLFLFWDSCVDCFTNERERGEK